MTAKPRIAVHKFSSCDGCQLALLNLGNNLLDLAALVDVGHFAEAGPLAEDEPVDIAFVEGSISTAHDRERIQRIRTHSNYLVTIGACATSGGIQALRNLADAGAWRSMIYPHPEYLDSLDTSTGISDHVRVDLELWGCPVSSAQVVSAIRSLLYGVVPAQSAEKVCAECKRANLVCVLVAHGTPCMGPLTRGGCGAICPSFGRDCYGCYGPTPNANAPALAQRFQGLGLLPREIRDRFHDSHSAREPMQTEGLRWVEKS